MKIEERAKEFALRVKDIKCGDCDSCSKCNDYITYVDIATEQKKIDIDKALSFLRYYSEGDFSCMEEFEAKFRKAMEK